MGGCIITAKGATEAECERKLDEEIEKARELGLEDIRCRVIVELDDGWLVEEIMRGSGAAQSGLRVGDIILSINEYVVRYEHDISYIMNQFFSPEDRVILKVLRGDKVLDIQILLGSR